MNQQYLKKLQERAQKLLQISSQDEREEIQNQTFSQKYNGLKLQNQNMEQEKSSLPKQLAQYKFTDIQLLKKCIFLTSQNNKLKIQLQKQKQKNSFICNQIKDYKTQLKQSKKTIQNLQKIYNQQKTKVKELQTTKFKLYKQQSQKVKLKTQQLSRLQVDQQNQKQRIQQQLKQYKEKNQLLYVKLGNISKQNKILEREHKNQMNKTQKLSQFIKDQIPKLKDIITRLSQKLEIKIQKVLIEKSSINY